MSEATARSLDFSRDWAGLNAQGRILISIDRVVAGDPLSQVLAHETAHDVLLKTSSLGWAQLLLSPFALDPFPPGAVRDRCGRLLGITIDASRYTQEAVATFLPEQGLDAAALAGYRRRHTQDYLDAAEVLEWLPSRSLGEDVARDLAFATGALALDVPVLDDWRSEGLHDPEAAARWFDVPGNRPDRRFPALCRALAGSSDRELRRAAEHGAAGVARHCAHVLVDGRPLRHGLLPDGVPNPGWLQQLAENLLRPILHDPALSMSDRQEVEEGIRQPWMFLNLQPTLMSVLLTFTTSTSGRIDVDPPTSELHGYPLVHVLHNAFSEPVPGVEPVGAPAMLLREGESALWFVSPAGGNRACHLSPGYLREWLDQLSEDTTVCVRDGGYFFGVPIGEPRLKRRRHVVLIQHRTPQQLVNELPVMGLDENRGPVLMTLLDSDYPDVDYLLLRPRSGNPVVMLPTTRVTAQRTIAALTAEGGEIGFTLVDPPTFFGDPRQGLDVLRVLTDFEAREWRPELIGDAEARKPAPETPSAESGTVEQLMAEARERWSRYEAERSRESFAAVAESLEEVLAEPALEGIPLARRVDVLDAVSGSFYSGFEAFEHLPYLRRAVEARRRLLELLPEDWPGRMREMQILGRFLLRLWATTGDRADREEGVQLMKAAHAPGFG
jgi:hypothetical protein